VLPVLDRGFFAGLFFVALMAAASLYLAALPFFQNLHIHALLIGMIVGMVIANTIGARISDDWRSGFDFSARRILRLAIILYGFRLTFQDIGAVGISGVVIAAVMVGLTFLVGYLAGVKLLKMDKELSILCASGAAICGAAAVLATEGVIKAKPYKTVVALITVVLFGTLAMFAYPAAYMAGYVPMGMPEMGVYIGASVHEVAHVAGAALAIDPDVADSAVIVKMLRVMMLAPFLVLLGLWFWGGRSADKGSAKVPLIPWFAVLFIVMAGVNSLGIIPQNVVSSIIELDTFLLVMAMSALGLGTDVRRFKEVGMKPFYLGLILFLWLVVGGFFLTKTVLYLF
jgi:uncharacterized integral membrane protein (TIGR00698 family)